MTPWFNIALAAKLTTGSRRRGGRISGASCRKTDTVTGPTPYRGGTPRRFVSLPKLLKPNEAIDAMLRTFRATFDLAAEQGLNRPAGAFSKLYIDYVPDVAAANGEEAVAHTMSGLAG